MKFDVTIMHDDLNVIPNIARELEERGVDAMWTPETAHNPFLPLTLAAYVTEKLEVGTAIAVAFPTSPMKMAYIAWDLAAQSRGRFILGLGTQVKAHIVRRFSSEWGSPGPRLKDYILAMRAIWDAWQNNGQLRYEGEFYKHTLMTPFFQPSPIEHPGIPVYIAGVNSYLCQLAGEICQGFHVHPFHTTGYLRDVIVTNVEEGAQRTGRSRADVNLTCAIFVVTGETEKDIENDVAAVKSQIAFYASTPSYRPVLEHHGMGDLQDKLSIMAREGRWFEMHEAISDDLLDKVAVVATHDDLAHKVKERYEGLLDRVGYYFPYIPGERTQLWDKSLAVFAD
ncbi:MAG: TIGR03617 family F420-dependent LLM class oxidoreductase [Chloroflexi bacterium]|nr:TIGR03617 family F420-dependent LLM class oxidoreductase [Chloroflexota bacterium]